MLPRSSLSPPLLSPISPSTDHVPHNYGTRTRKNSIIRPSARLRDCAVPSPLSPPILPRRIKPLASLAPNSNTPPFLKIRCDKDAKELRHNDKSHRPSVDRYIEFPPKHVVLHPDDASNKVFLAIGRALISVNNCAMTVKDLAELTLRFGLVCQNASAAGQAITSFIRNHLHRCEIEQDFPLLLRHVLSGTARDDSLVPALYSRSGGNVGKDRPKDAGKDKDADVDQENPCKEATAKRQTWFRRGTTVWYLSKATGAPCPFARCGIALRDYADVIPAGEGRSGSGSATGTRDAGGESGSCLLGMKRKREREGLRRRNVGGGALGGTAHREEEEEDNDDLRAGRKPAKVKLTLRLKPCLSSMRDKPEESSSSESESESDDDDEDNMSIDSSRITAPPRRPQKVLETEPEWLPPYPIQRRISIPPYTPCESTFSSYPLCTAPIPTTDWSGFLSTSYRRATSVPMSVASPPPDSEDDDDFHISMNHGAGLGIDSEMGWEWEDSTEETEGTRSPERESTSERPISPVIVKTEEEAVSGDMRGMLEAWERMDFSSSGAVNVKTEADDGNIHDLTRCGSQITLGVGEVKVEELEGDSLSFDVGSPDSDWPDAIDGAWRPHSPEDVSLAIGDLQIKQEDDVGQVDLTSTVDLTSADPVNPVDAGMGGRRGAEVELIWKDIELLGPDSVHPQEFEEGEWIRGPVEFSSRPPVSSSASSSTIRPAQSLDITTPPQPASSPDFSEFSSPGPSCFSIDSPPSLTGSAQTWSSPEMERDESFDCDNGDVVIRMCEPCGPLTMIATCIDGVPVYQASASPPLLRRIDTDFVHLPSLAAFLERSYPDVRRMPEVTVFEQTATECMHGPWVPLPFAQAFLADAVEERRRALEVFLSDRLYDCFPVTLGSMELVAQKTAHLDQLGNHSNSSFDSSATTTPNDVIRGQPLTPQRPSQPLIREIPMTEEVSTPWERGMISHWDVEDHMLAVPAPFALSPIRLPRVGEHSRDTSETPLSPAEEEMFQSLCRCLPDWEDGTASASVMEGVAPSQAATVGVESRPEDMAVEPRGRDEEKHEEEEAISSKTSHNNPPPRRSKRVAHLNALACQRTARGPPRKRAPIT